jgi:hypothetical protein
MIVLESFIHFFFFVISVLLPQVRPSLGRQEGQTEEQPVEGEVRRERGHQRIANAQQRKRINLILVS